ncbi:hypothetical protein AANUM_0954 [Aggregatibacter actinomycetemcomitans NUM4039]|nr:hypothetical protein AANUM_0954 [Aggregatibacter actinomycetemcomitans NUM4039]
MTNHQSADNQHELEQEIQSEDVVDELKEQGEDPLEEAIARVQELEAQLAETSKKNRIYCYVPAPKSIIFVVAPNKILKKRINLLWKNLPKTF